ncbi:CMP-N-acetylneuraminate-beta-galactosamide-alpha-2,3-sialyltransferase 4-like isoform X4 [Cygnus atratus]|uniref:CMP-N-acetylneuraminate-beta-galactosamide- alpha-2,3-sialyltransferase 4-like isoform X4 n=1 Tax=Cygnus atratus TaxID=8868 RepID=UPI0015D5D479|nr:CMP-N-acetylneuraminate-beta-galactosamide-alpha-2,3-sialyltransferase 4-like isoform X4 [Cygnus atratus]
MNARSVAGRLVFALFQWKRLVILLCVGLCMKELYYVMNTLESHVGRRVGACQRRFMWRKPFLGRSESHWKPFLTSKSLYSLMDRPFRQKAEEVLWFHELPFGLQSSVLSAFSTLQLLPEQELPGSFGRLWCQRCIVVGNGYSIHGQRFGNLIDSHHVIIRLNDAPVKEYKKDVGERTSIRLFFPESALPNPLENNDNDTLMVFVPFKPLDFLWLREVLLKTRNKRYATTGIIALNLALHICQEVNIAGFGYPGNHDNTTPIHYYNTGRSRKEELIQHNLTAERNWLLKMIEWGVIADLANPAFQAQNH